MKSLRRRGRPDRTSVTYGAGEMGRASGWAPGQEPGIDTSNPAPPYSHGPSFDGGAVDVDKFNQKCEITVVDFSGDNMTMVDLDNDNLEEFLQKDHEDWVDVRWINVNGLSWDVIRLLGNLKGLHRLAIEDLMNTKNRTKVDWYSDHTYMVLPLQKLINLDERKDDSSDDDDKDSDADSVTSESEYKTRVIDEKQRRKRERRWRKGAVLSLLLDIWKPMEKQQSGSGQGDTLNPSNRLRASDKISTPWAPRQVRTLQRYHSGPNQDRVEFMERHAVLGKKGLGVSVEQVSIFLCADNTVISFFEYSASDVQSPIIRRLQTSGTILRQSADASMLVQSILDAIIDLAIPVTTAYQDSIGDLELDVLTDPDIHQSTALYILTSEIAVLRNTIAPVSQLIGALKVHKSDAPAAVSRVQSPPPVDEDGSPLGRPPLPRKVSTITSGVCISPLTITYLGDVEDHALLIQDSYDQMRRSADNLVDLIFNTVSAYQNESMKQLTIVTCFFLPLSFLTGYFGMNFATFPGVTDHSDKFFWLIACPVSAVVFMLLLRDSLMRLVVKYANRALIRRARRRRLKA